MYSLNRHNNSSTQLSYKRQQFRNSIRRKQIQQYFTIKRLKYAQTSLMQQRQQIINKLNNQQNKKIWLYQKACLLSNNCMKQWYKVLRQLSLVVSLFEDNYGIWIESGIIDKLCKAFMDQFREYQLIQISACILEDIFYNIQDQQNIQILQILAQNNFFNNLTNILNISTHTLPIFLQLTNSILHNRQSYLCKIFVQNNLIQTIQKIIDFHLHTNPQSDQIYLTLCIGYRITRGLFSQKQQRWKGSVISVLIKILNNCIKQIQRNDSIRVILKTFAILGQCQKQSILSQLFFCQNLIKYILKQLTNSTPQQLHQQQPINRSSACNILASILTSQNPKYHRQLVNNNNLLNKLLICTKIQNNHQQCLNSILKILSNIISTSIDLVKIVIKHEIFQNFVIYWAKKYIKYNNHQDAIFILCTIVQYRNYQLIQILIRKYYVFDIFIESLKNQIGGVQNCMEILGSFICILRVYNQIYRYTQRQKQRENYGNQYQNLRNKQNNGYEIVGHHRKIAIELESVYNIFQVLDQVQARFNNKKIEKFVSILLEQLNAE